MENQAVHDCPVCGTHAELYDVVDFNKSCRESEGIHLHLCGVPIYYRRCAACEYTWAPEFRDWSDEDFLNHIYITRTTSTSTPTTSRFARKAMPKWSPSCSASSATGSATSTMAAAMAA